MATRKCEYCDYYFLVKKTKIIEPKEEGAEPEVVLGKGHCRRKVPSMGTIAWPSVTANLWCGEYQPATNRKVGKEKT